MEKVLKFGPLFFELMYHHLCDVGKEYILPGEGEDEKIVQVDHLICIGCSISSSNRS
jgi:hypothetical protein